MKLEQRQKIEFFRVMNSMFGVDNTARIAELWEQRDEIMQKTSGLFNGLNGVSTQYSIEITCPKSNSGHYFGNKRCIHCGRSLKK